MATETTSFRHRLSDQICAGNPGRVDLGGCPPRVG
jgi:hypothetical protein